MGTSLGSFIATLTSEMDPRFSRVAILLGGGALVDAFYDHPQAAPYRRIWELLGGNKEQVIKRSPRWTRSRRPAISEAGTC